MDTDAVPKKRGPKTDVLDALVKRVNGLEKRLKDESTSEAEADDEGSAEAAETEPRELLVPKQDEQAEQDDQIDEVGEIEPVPCSKPLIIRRSPPRIAPMVPRLPATQYATSSPFLDQIIS